MDSRRSLPSSAEPRRIRLAPSFLPDTAVLELTYRCSHQCVFCSCPWFGTHPPFEIQPEMSTREWQSLISLLCSMGITRIAFTGGEPLLRGDLEALLLSAAGSSSEHIACDDRGLHSRFAPPELYLLSNGSQMNERILALCASLNVRLSLSLPGLKTFGYHTGGTAADGVLGWFRRAKNAGVRTTVGVTVTRRNLHELFETVAEAFLAGADTLLLNRFLPGGRGSHRAGDLMLHAGEIPQMLDVAEEVLTLSGRNGSVGTELPRCLIDPGGYAHLRVGTRCSAAVGFFVVGPSGFVRVCNHSPTRLHHWTRLHLLKADPYWQRVVQKRYLPRECHGCLLATECDGGCREAAHVVTGTLDGIDPALVERGLPFGCTTIDPRDECDTRP